MSHAGFERNVARLRRASPAAAEACGKADDPEVSLVRGPGGEATVSWRGALLASAYDPVAEGARVAAEIEREPCDVLVAVGLGLGHHLERFRARSAAPILVFEPSPACLRAALEAREQFSLLDQPDVFVCTTPDELVRLLGGVYVPGLLIRTHLHPVTVRNAPDAVRAAVRQLGVAKDALDVTASTRVHMMERWSRITVENAPALLASPSVSRLFGAFAGVPAVVAAAGPSLDKQLPALREAQGRVLIIAIGQTLRALRAAGIEPDLVHAVESQDVSHQLRVAGDISGVNLVVPASVHPAVLELPVRRRILAVPGVDSLGCFIAGVLGDRHFVAGGATVAQSAVHLAASLGAGPILLIGQDLAFTGGRVYAAGSAYDGVRFAPRGDGRHALENTLVKAALFGTDARGNADDPETRTVMVEGVDGQPVPTSVSYASFVHHYRAIGEGLRAHGIRLVNCTEGGALLPGIEHAAFARTLAACTAGPVDTEARLAAALDDFEPAAAERFAQPLARVQRTLSRLESLAQEGLAGMRSAAEALRHARSDAMRADALRRVAKLQRRLRRGLERAPWLDAFLQRELHLLGAAQRRANAADPGADQVLGEGRQLCEATLGGVARARTVFGRLAERIGLAAPDGRPGGDPHDVAQADDAAEAAG